MVALQLSCGLSAHAEIVLYDSGHGDIKVTGTPGNYSLQWDIEDVGIYQPGDVVTKVRDGVRTTFSSSPALLSLTGLTAGQPGEIWILPQVENPLYAWPGLSLGGIGGTGTGSFRLLSVSKPIGGDFSVWTPGSLDNSLNFLMTTADGINPVLSGPGPQDTITLAIGSHAHFNFGFTAAGIYDITMDVVGTRNGTAYSTPPGTFRFSVGDATAVPEPGSIVLVIATLGILIAVRRRYA